MTHFLYIPFTGLGLRNGYRGDQWLKNRLRIFKSFVLPSLTHQTNKDFILWFSWRPEEKDNPVVLAFMDSLYGVRNVKGIHTFGGVCFYDDKYPDKEAGLRLMQSLKNSLPDLAPLIKDETVLMTIQPSDDMYFNDAVEKIQDRAEWLKIMGPEKKWVIGWKKGYIMNYNTKEVAEYTTEPWKQDHISTYHTDTVPPFFTIMFPKDVFLDPQKHFDYIGPYKSHEYIIDYFDYSELEGRGFVVGTHGANISTVWNHRYKGRVLEGGEKDSLLIRTNTYNSEPITFPPDMRVRARKIFNYLPFQKQLTKIYHSLPINLRKL